MNHFCYRSMPALLLASFLSLHSNLAQAQNASEKASYIVGAVSLLGASAVGDSVGGGNLTEMMMSNAKSGQASFLVVTVGAISTGTVYVVQQASTGVKFSLQVSGQSIAKAGDSLNALARPTGVIMTTQKNEVLAFVPNDRGAALTANEKAK